MNQIQTPLIRYSYFSAIIAGALKRISKQQKARPHVKRSGFVFSRPIGRELAMTGIGQQEEMSIV